MFAGDLIHVVSKRSFRTQHKIHQHTQTYGNVSFMNASHSHTCSISIYLQSNRFEYAHMRANKCNPICSLRSLPLQLSLATECSLAWLAFTAGRRENDPVVRQTVLRRERDREREREREVEERKGVWGHKSPQETYGAQWLATGMQGRMWWEREGRQRGSPAVVCPL